jgi:four helix bundle protein
MATIKSFRDLAVWNQGMDLAERVYRLTARFPEEERFGLTAQARRAALSVPSNIAEGHTRESTKEYLRGLSVAQASLAELQTQLELAMRLPYATQTELSPLLELATSLSRQLYALRNAVRRLPSGAKRGSSPTKSAPTPNP